MESASKSAGPQIDRQTEPTKVFDRSVEMPWIYPPWQTWAYVGGFATLCVIAFRTWSAGRQSVIALQQKHFSVDSAPVGGASHPVLIKPSDLSKETK